MTSLERYSQLLRTDPHDPLVAEEIAKGMRWPWGETDIHHHLPRLREAARGNVLEIGVRYGASTAALLAGVEEHGGHLYSIDIEPCEFARSLFDGHPKWTFFQEDSKARRFVHCIVNTFWSDSILDLCLVDGDHTYEGVLADLTNVAFVATTIMVHDYDRWNTPEVVRAVGTYLKSGRKHKRLRVYRESHGMAVLT